MNQSYPIPIDHDVNEPARSMSEEEHLLALKLKETYKNIVNFEEIVQKNCIDITYKINNIDKLKTSDLLHDLWTVYHNNLSLLNNYYDFLVTALKPLSNQSHLRTGKNIVEIYKLPRRMWVYGVVGFLEVLKNIMSIFQDHEICLYFISYCFSTISNLTDPILEMEGWWSEKLGDLSRMAIALYASKFIDWKISAESWYSTLMRTLYGHGKIYYHMCTVQQDNLDALVNIGKSVICRDPFVPTQHYLRLVVENICTQRNILPLLELPIIDFIKIHKVLLSIYTNRDLEKVHGTQIQYGIDLVTRYGLTFGSDSNGYNFFTREFYTPSGVAVNETAHQSTGRASNALEKVNFWFTKGSLFAISNINHLIGFGDAKNPFAKLFQLPEALKERKDKKDRKRKSRNDDYNSVDGQSIIASDLSVNDWFYCLQFINKSVLELSSRILNHYLIGPKEASTGHIIVWLYFLYSVGEATEKFPNSKQMFFWVFQKLFPWDSFIVYINSLLEYSRNSSYLRETLSHYVFDYPDYLSYFNENEFLPEVWKCWGTLWFDQISEKLDYKDSLDAGVRDGNLFDLPISGISSVLSENDVKLKIKMDQENESRIIRIILIARLIADKFPDYGLIRTVNGFKYNKYTAKNSDSFNNKENTSIMENFLFSDGRFVQNNLIKTLSENNLAEPDSLSPGEKDQAWFGLDNENRQDIDTEEFDDYYDSEFEVEDEDDDIEDENDPAEDYYYQQNQEMQHQNIHQNLSKFNLEDELIEGNFGDRMDTNVTYITLDTNIWLKHCGRVFKCVRDGVFKISVPLIVFQELRALRKSAEATIADAATRSVIIIRELYLTREILPLRFDGTVASDINETTEFENNSNWRGSVDETILNAVNEHDQIGKKLMKGINVTVSKSKIKECRLGLMKQDNFVSLSAKAAKLFCYCILVTDDRNMRLRAKTYGLASFQSKWLFSSIDYMFPNKCVD